MGCCISSPNGNAAATTPSPYGNTTSTGQPAQTNSYAGIAAHHASTSSITPSTAPAASQSPLLTHRRRASAHGQRTSTSTPRSAQFKHPNKPLNPPPKSSTIQPPPSHSITVSSPDLSQLNLTRKTLLSERRAFFDTRVTGRSEVWAALRLVCEMVEKRQLGEAQVVLDAAGCTCPSGDVWGKRGGVYDEFGEKYVVPSWIVGEPAGVVDERLSDMLRPSSGADESRESRQFPGQGKGKGRLLVEEDQGGGNVKVRVRLSHTARDIVVRTSDLEEVSVFVRRIMELAELPPLTKVKIGYLGKILHEHESLTGQGWQEGHILNVYVFD